MKERGESEEGWETKEIGESNGTGNRGKKLEVGSAKVNKDERVKEKKAARPSAEERKRAQRVQEIEMMIESLEKRLAEIGTEIESSGGEATKVRELSEEYANVEKELSRKIEMWEKMLEG